MKFIFESQNYLPANPDVTLPDEDPGVVDGLGEPELENNGLKAPLHKIGDLERKHVIELHVVVVKKAEAVAPE